MFSAILRDVSIRRLQSIQYNNVLQKLACLLNTTKILILFPNPYV